MSNKTELVVISYFDNGIFQTASIQHSTPEYTEKKVDEMVREHGYDILDVVRYDSETLKPITDEIVGDKLEQDIREEIKALEGEIEVMSEEINSNQLKIQELRKVLLEIKKRK